MSTWDISTAAHAMKIYFVNACTFNSAPVPVAESDPTHAAQEYLAAPGVDSDSSL